MRAEGIGYATQAMSRWECQIENDAFPVQIIADNHLFHLLICATALHHNLSPSDPDADRIKEEVAMQGDQLRFQDFWPAWEKYIPEISYLAWNTQGKPKSENHVSCLWGCKILDFRELIERIGLLVWPMLWPSAHPILARIPLSGILVA